MTGGKEMFSNYHLINTNGFRYHPFQPTYYPHNHDFRKMGSEYFNQLERQQRIRGQATWTNGGTVTKCGIPWSDNEYMTAAVGTNTPYKCGQTLKIRNLSTQGGREIIVTVVDQVHNYPPNRVNLHRRAFEALGAPLSLGVINIEIIPHPELEQEKWGKYLLEIVQSGYPGFNVTDYKAVGKTIFSPERTRETYDFILESPKETMKIRGNVTYNPKTDRIINFDFNEV